MSNRLQFVLTAVDGVINKIISYEQISLMSVLHCYIYQKFD